MGAFYSVHYRGVPAVKSAVGMSLVFPELEGIKQPNLWAFLTSLPLLLGEDLECNLNALRSM